MTRNRDPRARDGGRWTGSHRVAWPLVIGLAAVLTACTGSSLRPDGSVDPAPSDGASPVPSSGIGQVIAAPGSDSRIFAPNPETIVVAIDPGHGGCLDWGVANPYDNTIDRSEKSLTLGISLALRSQLEGEGVTVVMTREDDVALAGDLYPELGCTGDSFRDVNGDGEAGFGPGVPEATRTRDELSAHIDLVNLARADVLVSVHINSFTENGVVVEIAGTETYWTDETPWGVPHSERLATRIQGEVVAAVGDLATYERQDRGIDAVNYYIIAPATETGDPSEPRRGILMPGVLAEVGSMSLEAEADLLADPAAQAVIAAAVVDALAAWFAERTVGVRIDAVLPGGDAGLVPDVRPGSGPPFFAPELPPPGDRAPTVEVTLTNTGQEAWPGDVQLFAGWEITDEPYLARRPELMPLDLAVPALAPGESVKLPVELPDLPAGGRAVSWITLQVGGIVVSDLGIPALQLAVQR